MSASVSCNICGKTALGPESNGRLATTGLAPRCLHCGSLEHHRCVHNMLAAVPAELLAGSTCLCLTRDAASDAAAFGRLLDYPVPSAGAVFSDLPSGCAWAYSSWPVAGRSEPALLEELLRVVGSGFVVLVEENKGPSQPHERGAAFCDALRRMLPGVPMLELVALDPCTLTLSCAVIVSRDAARLVELARAVTQHNIHTRVFGADASLLKPAQSSSAPSASVAVASSAPKQQPGPLSPLAATRAGLPPEFDEEIYRSLHRDLAKFSGASLRDHYLRYGVSEGRRAHVLKDREAFAALLSPALDVLEIGPLFTPLLRGPRVRYFELFDTQNLRARAVAKGHPPELVPDIDYVSPTADLSIVDAKFDAIISSHVIEHQPDLLAHLDIVRGLLRPGGLYFVLVPDKDHCFDHFMPPSTIAEVLDAHVSKRTRHTLRSQVAYAALRTHNDSARHWRGDHGPVVPSAANVARAVEEYLESGTRYEDVNAWYFTPDSFRGLLEMSHELGETEFSVLRLYPALTDSNEFWAILEARTAAQ